MLIPRDTSRLGIIIEFKRIKDISSKTMDEGVREALHQIEENKYEAELQDSNVYPLITDLLAIASWVLIVYAS